MKLNMNLGVVLAGITALTVTGLQAATVNWGNNNNGNAIATASGILVPSGSLIRIGAFPTLTPLTIASNANNLSFLDGQFIEFGTTTVGAGNPFGDMSTPSGFWAASSFNLANATADNGTVTNIAGQQIYYWVFNASTLAAATQDGIYTAPGLATWKFPDDAAVPSVTNTDLSQVPNNSNGIIIGSYNVGASPFGPPNYNLALIPEPSTVVMLILVGIVAVGVARRGSKVGRPA